MSELRMSCPKAERTLVVREHLGTGLLPRTPPSRSVLKEGNFEQIEADVSQGRGVYIEVHDPTEVEHHPRLDAKIYPFNFPFKYL